MTGVNDKINKAAAKVFGDDLVKIGNIAGMAYGAYNGSFSLDPAKEFLGIGEAAASGANVIDGLGAAPELTSASWAADGAANTAAITEAAGNVAPSVFDKMDFSAADPTGPTDILNNSSGMRDAKVVSSNSANTNAPVAPPVEPAKTNTSGFGNAAKGIKPMATAAQATAPGGVGIQGPSTGYWAAGSNATAAQPSVFDRVLSKVGDKTIAGLIQGAGAGYSAAQKAKMEQEQMEEANRRYRSTPTFQVRAFTGA